MNFILNEDSVKVLIDSIKRDVVGFKVSEEFLDMRDYETDLPGVVGACFAKYLARNYKEFRRTNSEETFKVITSAHAVLEKIAESKEADIVSLLVEDIFESLHNHSQQTDVVKENMLPRTLARYNTWVKSNQ